MKKRYYTCASCHNRYESGWTEAEAEAEYINNFPQSVEHEEPRELVCEDCYNQMLSQINPQEYERQHYEESDNRV